MKYIVSLVFLCIIVFFSCQTGKENAVLFGTNNLKSEYFSIDPGRDTVLQTENGALLKILAGSLGAENGKKVELEIKEAYSMEQIVKAGLVTQSNGEPLSSGGMIYINGANNTKLTFKKAIQVAIPTDYLQEGMDLYKGVSEADGKIDWQKADSLPENKQLTAVDQGRILFQNTCSGCHAIGKFLTGPDLAHFMKRFPIQDEITYGYYLHIIDYYQNKIKMDDGGHYFDKGNYDHGIDIYKCNIRNMTGSMGTSYVSLQSDTSVNNYMDIFKYIQNESDRLNLPLPEHAYLKDCADSCEAYNSRYEELSLLKSKTEQERKKLIADNGEMTVITPDSQLPRAKLPVTPSDFDKKVSPENFEAEYYQFTVTSSGWYNIDMLLKNVNGVEESELFVRIVGEYTSKVNVFLIIPSVKVYGEGGPAEAKPGNYAFFYKTGKLPLPQGAKAYILAVSEQNDKIAFGLKEFKTGLKQELSLSLSISTIKELEAAVRSFDAAKLHINVGESKNASSIRIKDASMKEIENQIRDAEKLKPKNCDCDCRFFSMADTTSKETVDYFMNNK